MAALADARQALADAVTGAGIDCLAYPSDNLAPPIAFVDNIEIGFTEGALGGSFCLPGTAAATVVAVSQRHDREGATAFLEGLIPPVLDALNAIPGLRVLAASSGSLSIGGQDLPALTVGVQFPI